MGTKPSRTDRRATRSAPAAQGERLPLIGQAPGAEVRIPMRTWFGSLMLWMLSVGLLVLAFPPTRWTWAAHIALAPMLLAIARAPKFRVLLGSAALAGLAFYAGEMHWMKMVTWGAYVGVVLYCLIAWVLFAVLLKWTLDRTRLPLVLLAPLFWVALEWCRSWVLTGFPWLYLGHPQAATPTLLQVADLTGAYGLSALSAATAGFLADLLTHPLFLRYGTRVRLARTIGVSVLVLAAMWGFVIVYGTVRLQPVEMIDGPTVVVVQPNVPQELRWFTPENPSGKSEKDAAGEKAAEPSVAVPKPSAENAGGQVAAKTEADESAGEEDPSYKQAMDLTTDALEKWSGVGLVIWPETTVVDYLNPWYLILRPMTMDEAREKPYLAEEIAADPKGFAKYLERNQEAHNRARDRWKEINGLSARYDVDLLVGSMTLDVGYVRRNSAMLFRPDDMEYFKTGQEPANWRAGNNRYDKVHLVPFGEYTPLSKSAPWLYGMLLKFTPYNAAYNLTPGERLTVMQAGNGRFSVPICFEDAFADLCREMAYAGGEKRIDFLVNISNDGWFYGSVELDQHWDLSAFRAVENRVPVVRSVNTGLSGFIDSCGRTEQRVTDEKTGSERSITGVAAMQLKFDPRWSFYGLYGDVFAWALSGAAGLILVVATFHPRRPKAAPGEVAAQETKKEKAS